MNDTERLTAMLDEASREFVLRTTDYDKGWAEWTAARFADAGVRLDATCECGHPDICTPQPASIGVKMKDTLFAIGIFCPFTLLIRSVNPSGFRSGEWAKVVGIVWDNRLCYDVEFIDKVSDIWAVYDPADTYEFKRIEP